MRGRVGTFRWIFIAAGSVLVILATLFVVTSAVREWHIVQLYGDQGSLDKSWIEHGAPTFFDRLVGSAGRPFVITLRGDDSEVAKQVQAMESLHGLQSIIFDSVRASDLPDGEFQLPDVQELSFSSCEGDAVEILLSSVSGVSLLSIYDSEDLSDKHLDGQRFFAEIKAIELDGTGVSGTFLRNVGTARALSSVSIRYSPVSAEGLRCLARLPAVQHIAIDSPTSDISYSRADAILNREQSNVDIFLGGFREQKNSNDTEVILENRTGEQE